MLVLVLVLEIVCARDTPFYSSLSIPLADTRDTSAHTHILRILPLATRRPRIRRLTCISLVACHAVKTRVFDTMGTYLAAERSHSRSRYACAATACCRHSYRLLLSNGATTTLCRGTCAHILRYDTARSHTHTFRNVQAPPQHWCHEHAG